MHIHMFVFTEGAPIYGENSNEEIATYYDNITLCSKDLSSENQQYIKCIVIAERDVKSATQMSVALDFQYHQCPEAKYLNQ